MSDARDTNASLLESTLSIEEKFDEERAALLERIASLQRQVHTLAKMDDAAEPKSSTTLSDVMERNESATVTLNAVNGDLEQSPRNMRRRPIDALRDTLREQEMEESPPETEKRKHQSPSRPTRTQGEAVRARLLAVPKAAEAAHSATERLRRELELETEVTQHATAEQRVRSDEELDKKLDAIVSAVHEKNDLLRARVQQLEGSLTQAQGALQSKQEQGQGQLPPPPLPLADTIWNTVTSSILHPDMPYHGAPAAPTQTLPVKANDKVKAKAKAKARSPPRPVQSQTWSFSPRTQQEQHGGHANAPHASADSGKGTGMGRSGGLDHRSIEHAVQRTNSEVLAYMSSTPTRERGGGGGGGGAASGGGAGARTPKFSKTTSTVRRGAWR